MVRIIFLLILVMSVWNLQSNAQGLANDSPHILLNDSVALKALDKPNSYQKLIEQVLNRNQYFNIQPTPAYFISAEKQKPGKEFMFYFIVLLLLFLGFYKMAFGKYFNNIFKVFFNTSLRQNQLSDILRQSKLPSLILNIFFSIVAGFYLWLVFADYNIISDTKNKNVLVFTILLVGIVYSLKFFVLKFTGWVTGMSAATDIYIFIIFLINKMIALFLIPVVIFLSFSNPIFVQGITIFSFLIIGFLFLLQLFRSYGLLQTQLKMNWFHFFIYIIALEFIPYAMIFKWAATALLTKL